MRLSCRQGKAEACQPRMDPGEPEVDGCTGELLPLTAPSSSKVPGAAVPREEAQVLPAFCSQGEDFLGCLRNLELAFGCWTFASVVTEQAEGERLGC